MASGRSSGRGRRGFGVVDFMAILLAAALVLAFFKIPSHQSANGTLDFFRGKSETIKVWAEGLGDEFTFGDLFNGKAAGEDPSTPGGGAETPQPGEVPSPPEGSASTVASTAMTTLETLTVAPAEQVAYNRDEWHHWITAPGSSSCWSVRDEVLYLQAQDGSLVLLNSSGTTTTDKASACSIQSGSWVDPYGGATFTNPSDLDIDHMIPLGYAAKHGGQSWDASRKEQYANSLESGHLLAVSASENRSKSDSGPSEWQPDVDKCSYAINWVTISSTWSLTVDQADKDALKSMLDTCPVS